MHAAVEGVRQERHGRGHLRVDWTGAIDRHPTVVRLGMPRGEAVKTGKGCRKRKHLLLPATKSTVVSGSVALGRERFRVQTEGCAG